MLYSLTVGILGDPWTASSLPYPDQNQLKERDGFQQMEIKELGFIADEM